jgi:hypothetical protein
VLAEKGLKKSWLAARIHKSPAAISKLIKSPTIDLYLLIDISTALQYDFLEFMEQIKQNQ